MMLDKIALVLTIIGGINWGLIGLFQFDLVAWIFFFFNDTATTEIYTIVALASIWCITLLFQENRLARREEDRDVQYRAA